jgi:dephospho-CoA kinase
MVMLLETAQSRHKRLVPIPSFSLLPLLLLALLLQNRKETCGWCIISSSPSNRATSLFTSCRTTTASVQLSMTAVGAATGNADGTEMQQQQPTDPPQRSPFRVLGVCGGIGSGKSTACKLLVSPDQYTGDDGTESGADSPIPPCLAHIDADSIAHSVYAPGSQAVRDIVAEFGPGILLDGGSDGASMQIDRKKLGAVVFADRPAMAKLEAIAWPHVKKLITDRIEDLRQEWNSSATTVMMDQVTGAASATSQQQQQPRQQSRPIVVLEAAVLLDAGWDDLLDGVWVVTTPKSTALERLMQTRGLSQEEAQKRIDAQQSRRGIGTIQEEIDNGIVTGVIENNGSLESLKKSLNEALDDPKFWKR